MNTSDGWLSILVLDYLSDLCKAIRIFPPVYQQGKTLQDDECLLAHEVLKPMIATSVITVQKLKLSIKLRTNSSSVVNSQSGQFSAYTAFG
ncbi:hypothetical protein B0A49_07948, partial [Cryomyces minteri]